MKWTSADIDMYSESKEYVDSLLFPLVPLSFDENIKGTAISHEFITALTYQLEKQFKGRLLLLPVFVYMESMEREELFHDLLQWERKIKQTGFKHLFYLTSDGSLTYYESKLSGDLITIFEKDIQQNFHAILEDNIKQISSLFFEKWQGIELT